MWVEDDEGNSRRSHVAKESASSYLLEGMSPTPWPPATFARQCSATAAAGMLASATAMSMKSELGDKLIHVHPEHQWNR